MDSVKPIVKLEQAGSSNLEKASLLPCHISYDGPAPVFEYFHDKIQISNNTHSKTTVCLRGRELNGEELDLPENYTGQVVLCDDGLENDETSEKEIPESTWCINSTFEKVMLWNRDNMRSSEKDQWKRGVLEWIQFASKVKFNCSLYN
ncbi:ribonuclease H2 complex subunit Rnh203 [Schizosaccharomyces pombe]|uniref:Uncharacterized protein C12B10.15c n=1 Tax=Schizosaccharomyces pombe (strain 972 / ATCC 24843) TaxID=284812 RepID=YDEF_SCHPO|nr:putative ribonuclease H2 complex subunit [Schizosaccharomyces pombe]Q10448.1 RecName: Full=Uncharacterized protein C12B10.15c [Schizosaccharomyces pombe 972h-]CAA94705.1 ribonuclease H2 complex subunit (predicted) [Schizosaccharomyces pombe]|eukprot:NP_594647.1 putative ribonuclease H2 complex subunit [Schizosaccharomyces pombe]